MTKITQSNRNIEFQQLYSIFIIIIPVPTRHSRARKTAFINFHLSNNIKYLIKV